MMDLVGLPLDTALARLAARGIHPRVVMTEAPRHPLGEGEARVLRLSLDENRLLAAVFPPSLPAKKEKEELN